MKLLSTEKKTTADLSWEEDLSKEEKIRKWRNNIYYIGLEKLQAQYKDTDTINGADVLFGNELYAGSSIEKISECNVKEIQERMEEDVVKPLGTEFTFTKISHDVQTAFLNRDPLKQIHNEGTIALLFNHGVLQDPYLHAFPEGKLLKNGSEIAKHPEFIFGTNLLVKDRFLHEHLKYGSLI